MLHTIPIELIELKDDIIDGMTRYMEADYNDSNADYTKEDIDKCDAILIKYMTTVLTPEMHSDTEKIMATVEKAVVSLNSLNEYCNYSLIETDEREGICNLIITAAAHAGLEADEYDITEKWRDW